jgi:hypothetical protein
MAGENYLAVEPLDRGGFLRVTLLARGTPSRDEELKALEAAFEQTTAYGKVFVECDSPLSLDTTCLADIGHMSVDRASLCSTAGV